MLRGSSPVFRFATLLVAAGPLRADDPFTPLRERMVRDQIESRGIHHPEVLRVMRATPRHAFVPESVRPMAYDDCALPLGYGSTISQPYIVALMTELLRPEGRHRALEVGTGSGYQAAVLAQLTRQVYSIEIVPELAKSARQSLARLGYQNVTVRQGDGTVGWREAAPFDLIIVTAAAPEVPPALIAQLALGGRLVAPVGSGWNQELVLLEKEPDGSLRRKPVLPVIFVPMRKPAR